MIRLKLQKGKFRPKKVYKIVISSIFEIQVTKSPTFFIPHCPFKRNKLECLIMISIVNLTYCSLSYNY
jgi:hypothetical protein